MMSQKGSMQEPRLASHAAPAQPQSIAQGDALITGDMHALLKGHWGQQQV